MKDTKMIKLIKNNKKSYDDIWDKKIIKGCESDVSNDGNRYNVAAQHLQRGDFLLDFGCGIGTFANIVRGMFEKIYGCEISEKAIKVACSRGIHAVKVDIDIDILPFENNFFDSVVCLDVIEHIKDPINLIKEMNRVLKPDGIIIITTPNIRHLKYILKIIKYGEFPKTSDDNEMYDGGHIHYFTFKDIEFILNDNGFRVAKKVGIGNTFKNGIWKFLNKKMKREFGSLGIMVKAYKVTDAC